LALVGILVFFGYQLPSQQDGRQEPERVTRQIVDLC
jgi:hypothetical protein